MSTPAPFDSDYTATNFVGFSISVDIVASDQTLGANWQSLSLGSVSLGAQDLQAGGYNRSRFQMLGSLDYGNVTLTRPWTANQSGWIAQWFSAAETSGPSTVSVTVNYLDVQGSLQQATYNFRNAYPVSWTQPDFVAVPSAETPPRITETLTFSHSGFAESGSLASGIDSAESVQPFKLVVLPGGVSGVASALSAVTSWTPGGNAAAYMPSTALSAKNEVMAKLQARRSAASRLSLLGSSFERASQKECKLANQRFAVRQGIGTCELAGNRTDDDRFRFHSGRRAGRPGPGWECRRGKRSARGRTAAGVMRS